MYYLPLLPLMAQRAKVPVEVQRDVYEVYVQEMINLSMGQAMDIAWHRGIANADDLGEDDYLQYSNGDERTADVAHQQAKLFNQNSVFIQSEKNIFHVFLPLTDQATAPRYECCFGAA